MKIQKKINKLTNLRIVFDIDDTIADFIGAYKNKEQEFWTKMLILRQINFEQQLYCTKRVNALEWAYSWLKSNNFPIKQIYQTRNLKESKINFLKNKIDIFINNMYNKYFNNGY